MADDPNSPSHPAENPLDFEPPSLAELTASLDGFEILAFLGKGPLGTVYKASQPKLDRLVALKIFPASVASESAFAKRFQTEAQTMARMRHDHIMSVHDFGESTDGKWLYIAMEWVDGDTLERALIKQNWDLPRKLAVAAQLCDALNYAHEHGIIHRDLKPGNVMLADEGRVKIADFGMATIVGTETYDTKLTHSTSSIGMPDFVAPEQLEPGNPVDHRADIYSVGVILYKMLTGYIPRGAYRPPSERYPGLDTRLDPVVARAMATDPSERYQTVRELMDALLDIHATPAPAPSAATKLITGRVPERAATAAPTSSTNSIAPSEGTSEKKMALGVIAVVAAGCLALVAGVFYFKRSQKPAPEPIIASVPQPEKSPSPPSSPPAPTPPPQVPAPAPAPASTDPPSNRATAQPEKPFTPLIRPKHAGELVAWMRNAPEDQISQLGPRPPGLNKVVALAAPDNGAPGVLALRSDGTVEPWFNKSVAPWRKIFLSIPSDLSDVVALGVGEDHALALSSDGTLVAWGNNDRGQRDIPSGLDRVIAVAAGHKQSLALRDDGTIVRWGFKDFGLDDIPTAAQSNVIAIAAGGAHCIVQKKDGTIVAWGRNDFGQATVPDNLGKVVAFAAHAEDSFYLTAEGRLEHRGQRDNLPRTLENIIAFQADRFALATQSPDGNWDYHGWVNKDRAKAKGKGSFSFVFPKDLAFAIQGSGPKSLVTLTPKTDTPPPPADPSTPEPAPAPEAPLSEAGQRIADVTARFEKQYENTVGASHHQSIAALKEKYLGALGRTYDAATSRGDLEAVLPFREEIQAQENAGANAHLGPLPAAAPQQLIDLRKTLSSEISKLESSRTTATNPIYLRFDKALEKLQEAFTRALKVEEALEIKSAREDFAAAGLPFLEKEPAPEATTDLQTPAPADPSEPATAPTFSENLPEDAIRAAPEDVKIEGALTLEAALAAARPRQTIALASGRYEPITVATEDLTLIGNRSAIGGIILMADGIELRGIESNNLSVGGYRDDKPVPVTDILLADSRLRSVTSIDRSEYEAVNCIGSFTTTNYVTAMIDHCTFVSRGIDNFGGHRIWYGSEVEIRNCVITGAPYVLATSSGGPKSCRIKGSLILIEKDFLAVETPPTPPATQYTWKPFDRRLAEREHNINLSGCILEDPQFVDAANSDFRLRDTSPGWKADRGSHLGANLDADGWPTPSAD